MARKKGPRKLVPGKRRVKREVTTNGGSRPHVISKITHLRSFVVNNTARFVKVKLPNGVVRRVPLRTYLQFVAEAHRRKKSVEKYIFDLYREARGE